MKDRTVDALQAKLKRKEEELKLKHLEEISTSLAQAKDNSNVRTPHKMAFNIAQSSVVSQPWITRNVINASFKNMSKIGNYKLFNLLKRCAPLSFAIPHLIRALDVMKECRVERL